MEGGIKKIILEIRAGTGRLFQLKIVKSERRASLQNEF